MEIKDAKLFINSDNDITAIKVNINGEDHLTGDVRHVNLITGEATGVFSNTTLMTDDEFIQGWYNTMKECVKYNITKKVIPISSNNIENRYNLSFIEFKFDTQN